MIKAIVISMIFIINLYAGEPISPIPLDVKIDIQKALLGKELFSDPLLSRDNSTACLNCHDIYNGGADANSVSSGFKNKKGNIQSPTVLNSRYNFKQFWNGRVDNLLEQAKGPLKNPVEHNMDIKTLQKRLNASKEYKKKFYAVYVYMLFKYTYISFSLSISFSI